MKNDSRALASVSALTHDIDEQTMLRHLLDCAGQCRDRCIPVYSSFLTAGEQALAVQLPLGEGFHLFGGFAQAERKIAVFLPDYLDESFLTDAQTVPDADPDFPVCAVRLTRRDRAVAGKPDLTHRDYLGSLLGLGIRRETLGDLCVYDGGCDVLCLRSMAAFLRDNVRAVGRVSVDAEVIALCEVVVPEKKVKVIHDTVASLRLDSVALTGFSLSRGKTADAIASGKAEVNACPCEKPDREVREGDIITAINGQTITNLTELNNYRDQYKAGDTVTLTVYRDGRSIDYKVVLGEANQ